MERYSALILVGRIGRADECSGVATLLASERGSFINGAEILIDGGMKVNGEVGHHKG